MPNHKALIVALEHFLTEWKRAEIDRQFAAMAADDEYQLFNEQLTESFAVADWEALQLAEETLALLTQNTKLE